MDKGNGALLEDQMNIVSLIVLEKYFTRETTDV